MPYVITTRSAPTPLLLAGKIESRRAVATLEEARREAARLVREHGGAEAHQLWASLGVEANETVGPLPDGTVIEVEQIPWADIAESVNWLGHGYVTENEWPEVIDAYNAREN